jgi:hypothetical protein
MSILLPHFEARGLEAVKEEAYAEYAAISEF